MNKHKAKLEGLKRRQRRVRGKVSGTSERPRLRVTRTNANIYAQIIDDSKGSSLTLVSASTLEAEFKGTHTSNKEAAIAVAVSTMAASRPSPTVLVPPVSSSRRYVAHGS